MSEACNTYCSSENKVEGLPLALHKNAGSAGSRIFGRACIHNIGLKICAIDGNSDYSYNKSYTAYVCKTNEDAVLAG